MFSSGLEDNQKPSHQWVSGKYIVVSLSFFAELPFEAIDRSLQVRI